MGTFSRARRRTRLLEWLAVIDQSLADLVIDEHIFRELQGVIRANPRFKTVPGTLTQWIARSFVNSAAVGVRRQVKNDKQSVSLRRVLEEIRAYPWLISRESYLKHFEDSPDYLRERGEEEFAELADKGGSHIDPAIVERDIADLTSAAERIERYADRRVAHYDLRGIGGRTPTFGDLRRCLQTFERIYKRYFVLLKGASLEGILPAFQFDWKAPLRFAWLPPPRRRREARR